MQAGRPVVIELDRDYDLRLLASVPSFLACIPRAELEEQLGGMIATRRALCFTLLVPIRDLGPAPDLDISAPQQRQNTDVAVVLVCLHVSPELASRGAKFLTEALSQAGQLRGGPCHELSAPMTRTGDAHRVGFYREAVYETATEACIAITTHTPAEIPPEAASAVAQATKGAPIDIVTTLAVTADRPHSVTSIGRRRPGARPTVH